MSKQQKKTTQKNTVNEIKKVSVENKNSLSTLFNYCLDILRNNEHLTGDKALKNLAYLLDLRLLEHQFGKEIDIDNYEYDFSAYGDGISEDHKEKLLGFVRFSNLAKEKEENIPNIIKYLWDDILSENPVTKNIFLKEKGFDIQDQKTYKKIIDKLNNFNFEEMDEDILGEAYEEVIKDIMTGKVLGQFFTPPKVKNMMIKLIDPQLKTDGTIEKIFDPAMGTGGFLISSLKHLIKQSKEKNIKMDWNYISKEGLGGREAESDTYQLAVSNMLISSGHMFDVLEKGDSIRDPIKNKYDIIFANPPFGIDGLIYYDIKNVLRDEYMPIKSNNAVSLFLQAIIYMLKINGRCAIVLPNGKELFGKNKENIMIREYLMKTCDLKEIIYLPSGVFTHTSIETCVFYFVKKIEGTNAVEIKFKNTKSINKCEREYKFSKIHHTTNVKFYKYDIYEDIKTLLIDVNIDDIINNSYSLNHNEYIKYIKENYNNNIIFKKIGDISGFLSKSKKQASYGKKEGIYPFFTSSLICDNYCDTYDYENECLIIGTGGTANIKYGSKFSCSTDNFVLKINDEYSTKYVYYYLLNNIYLLENGFCGVGLKHISKKYIINIEIPIPSIEKQQEIVKYLDFIEETNKKSINKIEDIKILNNFCLNNQKIYGNNLVKSLKEICEMIKGKKQRSKDGKKNGLYPLYYCSILGNLYLDTYDYTLEGIIINKINGTGKAMVYYGNNKYNVGETTLHFKSINNENVYTKYIYYYLLYNIDLLETQFKGANQKSITDDDFFNIKISIPSIECQKEIIDYCENNDILIKQLENEIENNKKQAYKFIGTICKLQDQIIVDNV
jgi:type I restriction enzyme S subunit